MQYLIFADEPFDGRAQTTVRGGVCDFTNGRTPEQYAEYRGRPVRVLEESEFESMLEEWLRAQVSQPVEISADDYNDALNVLPPERWFRHAGVELFSMCERITYDLTTWYARVPVAGGASRYFCFRDRAWTDKAALADKAAAATA